MRFYFAFLPVAAFVLLQCSGTVTVSNSGAASGSGGARAGSAGHGTTGGAAGVGGFGGTSGAGGSCCCGGGGSGEVCCSTGMGGSIGAAGSGTGGCAPLTCQDQGFDCGMAGDGCGNTIDCGTCSPDAGCPSPVCGGGGVPNVCGTSACTCTTCAALGLGCGLAGDGCGGQLDCGSCPSGQTCATGVCATCPTCTPLTCAEQNDQCGPVDDGCGNLLDCGTACGPPPECCNAVTSPPLGPPWSCGIACEINTCASLGVECGIVPNGCGDKLDCGKCPAGSTCGGGGPGHCGSGTCLPKTCAEQGYQCGPAGDGCGGVLDCGSCDMCTPGCGANTTPGHCAATLLSNDCQPRTCASIGYTCGPASDDCGGLIQCGQCQPGQACEKGQCVTCV